MTQPYPEPQYFDPSAGSEPSEFPDLLDGRRGIVAVLVGPEAHASGWASRTALALAETSLAAGHPAGLVDLALEDPRLHTAAGVTASEGISDVVLFGASLGRVSRWSSAGARIVPAGTAVGDIDEVFNGTAWVEAVRAAAEGGCVLAYVPIGASGTDVILSNVEDVILLRHEGEVVESLARVPSLVLEPEPEPDALDDAATDGSAGAEAEAVQAAQLTAAVAGEEASPETDVDEEATTIDGAPEVTLDLDDVVGDSESSAEPMFAPASPAPESDDSDSVQHDEDLGGLEVEPEWPAFEVPLVVQNPSEVDEVVAVASDSVDAGMDDGEDRRLDGILDDGTEVRIVEDDLGMSPSGEPDDAVVTEMIEGLVDSGQSTLNRVGESSSASADHVSGLEGPPGWDEPPSDPVADSSLDASVDVDAPDPDELARVEDALADPPELQPVAAQTSPDAHVPPAPVSDDATDEDATPDEAKGLPWEGREADFEDAVGAATDSVPVADVTRTRTRTRSKSPRPFLLIVFLLLLVVVAVLHWVGLLDIAGLNFSPREPF